MYIEDYRNSHTSKGGVYDEKLRASPLDAYMDRLEEHYLLQVLHQLFPNSVPRYLDFACGTGRITKRVERYALESCGVDVSESMLNVARQKCRATQFFCADLTKNDIELGLFDLVTAFRFFGNAQAELRDAALAGIVRHMHVGGYLILNNHRNPVSFLGAWGRCAGNGSEPCLSHFQISRLLRRHNLKIVSKRAIGFWLVRFNLATEDRLASAAAAQLDRIFEHWLFAPFAPDAVLVAQKVPN